MAGFGRELKMKKPYGDYIGKYVRVVSVGDGSNYYGMLREIKEASLVLHPFVGINTDKEFGPMLKLIQRSPGERFPFEAVKSIEPITLEEIFNMCAFRNAQQRDSVEKAKSKKNRTR